MLTYFATHCPLPWIEVCILSEDVWLRTYSLKLVVCRCFSVIIFLNLDAVL